jgi:hypothetical protein
MPKVLGIFACFFDGWIDGRPDGRTDGRTDGQTDGRTIKTDFLEVFTDFINSIKILLLNNPNQTNQKFQACLSIVLTQPCHFLS